MEKQKAHLSSFKKFKRMLRLKISIFLYSFYMKRLCRKISGHRPVRIVFYVNNLSMWKSDKLLLLLKKDKRFEPLIISHLNPKDSTDRKHQIESDLCRHFNKLGVTFLNGFDFENNKLLPVSQFKPDILFYPQPFINNLKDIPLHTLLSYIPYCFEMDKTFQASNTLYQNICWKYFVSTESIRQTKVSSYYNHGSNMIVSGNPIADYFLDGHKPSEELWNACNPEMKKMKRIIWAPHHSIMADDWLDYSTFLEIANDMIDIARKYKDSVQFVFKPHPLLKEKLYKTDAWGVEKTNAYYDTWEKMPNCSFADGNYVDLFMTSDAMIHDCSSFTVEYLYVNKPVMYLTKKSKIESFSSFADDCFQVHYHGSSMSDIESFIDNVINGIDPMAEKRTAFINDQLLPKDKKSTAENIYNELCKIFE